VTDKTNQLINKLRGILLPTTTNFNQGSSLDLASFRSNLDKWLTTDINGVVLLGSTGERVHLNEREYLQLIQTARAEVQSDRVLIVGAGQHSTVGTITEIQAATDAGADAVLVITPHFYRSAMTQDALLGFYNEVADASKIPVMLYSMPALTGIKIEPETVARLSEHPNIIGVKDSSNDMTGFSETVKLCPVDFAVMTGNGTVLLDALKAGATGGILAVGCAAPEICLEVFRLFALGEIEQAELLQSKLTPFAAAVTTRFGIGGLKAALDIAGYRGGHVRQPLQSPNEFQVTEIQKLYDDLFVTLK
jgi:dihydrodipicolinate synthase/N-acetylneuraminate lyase